MYAIVCKWYMYLLRSVYMYNTCCSCKANASRKWSKVGDKWNTRKKSEKLWRYALTTSAINRIALCFNIRTILVSNLLSAVMSLKLSAKMCFELTFSKDDRPSQGVSRISECIYAIKYSLDLFECLVLAESLETAKPVGFKLKRFRAPSASCVLTMDIWA